MVTEALNALCLSEPHWKVIASGFAVESWFADNQGIGSGGILLPRAIDLSVGQYYYRFTSSTSSREAQVGGGWWIDFENFSTIKQFASDNGYALPDAARLFLALPYDWSRMDRLVRALLEVPLKAYAGKGKPAEGRNDPRDRGARWIPLQHQSVTQLYIPGLVRSLPAGEQMLASKVYEKAFPYPEFEFIAGNRRPAPPPR